MPFARELSFEGGYRSSDYSSAGEVESYKAALDWQIMDDFRLRGSFQRAVRAPNVSELFRPDQFQLFGGSDPCSGPVGVGGLVASGATIAQCQATGLAAAKYGHVPDCSAAQCTNLSGGNEHLKPEESNTVSFGFVFTPTFLHGFNATVDYFDITVNHVIEGINPNVSLSQCIATGGSGVGNPLFCDNIHRSSTGQIQGAGYVTEIDRNIGGLRTKGVDWEVNYKRSFADMGMGDHGTLAVNWVGTYLENLITTPVPGFGSYDCAGLFGATCGQPSPHWRHKLRLTWVTPWNASFSLGWRYFGEASLDQNAPNPLLVGKHDVADAHIPAYSWFDLSGTWKVKDGYNLRFGVNNILDKDPPIVDSTNFGISGPPFGNGNTFPQVYDSLGRTFFLGITADF
jgi:outer membrane receptor protein involved in Fe transport